MTPRASRLMNTDPVIFSDSKPVIQAVIKHLKRWKLRWAYAFVNLQILPFFEIAILLCIYLMMSPEKQQSVASKITAMSWIPASFTGLILSHMDLCILVAGVCLLAVFVLLKYSSELNLIHLKYKIIVEDQRQLISRFLMLDTKAARKIGKAKITSSILSDCGAIGFAMKHSFDVLGAAITIVFYMIWTLFLSWQLALIMIGFSLFPVLLNRKRFGKVGKISRDKIISQERNIQFISEILNGFERAKIDGLEKVLQNESKYVLALVQKWQIDKRKNDTEIAITMESIFMLLLLGVVFAGVNVFNVPIATLTILFAGSNRMKTYLKNISDNSVHIKHFKPHILRYFALLGEVTPKIDVSSRLKEAIPMQISNIALKNVLFQYDDGNRIFNGLDFEAKAGDRILIQGPSGQGKSTFIQILCGILPPNSGCVLYNGRPLTEYDFYDYRGSIIYVSPTVYLFNISLKDNLVFGNEKEKISEERLQKALTLAGLEKTVQDLPNGLETRIGVNGCNLSLGERQRVLLARMYLRNPSLFILDEATANLDVRLENEIISNLEKFMDPSSILIMVAHKKPNNMAFTKSYHLSNGRLESLEARIVLPYAINER